MTTVQHPRFKPESGIELTTYDLVSTSPSKLKYSFGGLNNRFAKPLKPVSQVVGYTLPSTRSPKSCTFGIGERFNYSANSPRRTSVD